MFVWRNVIEYLLGMNPSYGISTILLPQGQEEFYKKSASQIGANMIIVI
jgi:hypothetical protein